MQAMNSSVFWSVFLDPYKFWTYIDFIHVICIHEFITVYIM